MIELPKKKTENTIERAILVGVINQYQPEEKLTEYLDELEFLAETAGAESVKRFSQKLDKPNPKTLLGSGKISEIALYIKQNNATGHTRKIKNKTEICNQPTNGINTRDDNHETRKRSNHNQKNP